LFNGKGAAGRRAAVQKAMVAFKVAGIAEKELDSCEHVAASYILLLNPTYKQINLSLN
jgi:hypothetical protein